MIVKVPSKILFTLLEHLLSFDEAHISWWFTKDRWRIFNMLRFLLDLFFIFLSFLGKLFLLLFMWVLRNLVLKALTFADWFSYCEFLDVLEFTVIILNILLKIWIDIFMWFLGRCINLQWCLWKIITAYDVVLVSKHLRLDSIPSLFILGTFYCLSRWFIFSVRVFFIILEFRHID